MSDRIYLMRWELDCKPERSATKQQAIAWCAQFKRGASLFDSDDRKIGAIDAMGNFYTLHPTESETDDE